MKNAGIRRLFFAVGILQMPALACGMNPCGACPECPPGYSCGYFAILLACQAGMPPNRCTDHDPCILDTCRSTADACTDQIVAVPDPSGEEYCGRLYDIVACGNTTVNVRRCQYLFDGTPAPLPCKCGPVIDQEWCPQSDVILAYELHVCL